MSTGRLDGSSNVQSEVLHNETGSTVGFRLIVEVFQFFLNSSRKGEVVLLVNQISTPCSKTFFLKEETASSEHTRSKLNGLAMSSTSTHAFQ